MDGDRNLFPLSPNFSIKCEQRQADRSPGGRLSGTPLPRQPLVDRGLHQVHSSSSLSTLAGSGSPGRMPSFSEAATAVTSMAGSWSNFSGRPQAADSAGRAPATASPGASGVTVLPPTYHDHLRPPSAGVNSGVSASTTHGSYGRAGSTLLLPVTSGTDRLSVATPVSATAGGHSLPAGRRHEAGLPPFGSAMDAQSHSFSSRPLSLPNGTAVVTSNPSSSRSLMPRNPKVYNSVEPSTSLGRSSLPVDDLPAGQTTVRQQHPHYVPSASGLSGAPRVMQDHLFAPDDMSLTLRRLAKSGSVNGKAATAGTSWPPRLQNPLMHTPLHEWSSQPVTTGSRPGQPARSSPAASSMSSDSGSASRRNGGEPIPAVPGAVLLKMAATSKGAASSTAGVIGASPLAGASSRPVAGRGCSAVGVTVGDQPAASGAFSAAFPKTKGPDRLPPPPALLVVKHRRATDPRQPLLPVHDRDESGACDGLERANDRLRLSGVSASGGHTFSGIMPVNRTRPSMPASASSSAATLLADQAASANVLSKASGGASRLPAAPTSELLSNIRRHVIEGFVIEESSQPFPVTRSSLLTSLVLKRKRGHAGRRNVRVSVAPQTDSSSRASSPLTASAAATPDSVTAANGMLPSLLLLSPAARNEADSPAPLHAVVSAAAPADDNAARAAAASSVSSKPSRAEPSDSSHPVHDAPSAEQRPAAAGSIAAVPVCTLCGRNEVRVRAFSGRTFCSKSCAAVYRRTYNADGSPISKRRRGRPPGSGSKLAEGTKRRPKRENSRQRRVSGNTGGSGEAVGEPPLVQQQPDSMAPIPGDGANGEPDSPASAGSGDLQVYDECLSRSKILTWNIDDVYSFILAMEGCSLYADGFRSQEIDGRALLLLSEDHLVNALNIKLGPALKIISAIGPFQ